MQKNCKIINILRNKGMIDKKYFEIIKSREEELVNTIYKRIFRDTHTLSSMLKKINIYLDFNITYDDFKSHCRYQVPDTFVFSTINKQNGNTLELTFYKRNHTAKLVYKVPLSIDNDYMCTINHIFKVEYEDEITSRGIIEDVHTLYFIDKSVNDLRSAKESYDRAERRMVKMRAHIDLIKSELSSD